MPAPQDLGFYHGLGDCVHFAHLLQLYTRRGFRFDIACTDDMKVIFDVADVKTTIQDKEDRDMNTNHAWLMPRKEMHYGKRKFHIGNKIYYNLSKCPLPAIGREDNDKYWDELCDVKLLTSPYLPANQIAMSYLANLPRPIIVYHSNTDRGANKCLPRRFTERFLDRRSHCKGAVIVLDRDHMAPPTDYRVLSQSPTEVLLQVIDLADLFVGIDSGPLHLCRMTNTPAIGLWMPEVHPAQWSLPRKLTLNVTLADHARQWNKFKRVPWNIIEQIGDTFDAKEVSDMCEAMLGCTPNQIFDNTRDSNYTWQ